MAGWTAALYRNEFTRSGVIAEGLVKMQMNDGPVMCLSIWGSVLLACYNEPLVHAWKYNLDQQAHRQWA